jgi:hypothetical protein
MTRDDEYPIVIALLVCCVVGVLVVGPIAERFRPAIDTGLAWFGGLCVAVAAIAVVVWVCTPRRG